MSNIIDQTIPKIFHKALDNNDIQELFKTIDYKLMEDDSGHIDFRTEKEFNRKVFKFKESNFPLNLKEKILHYSSSANSYYGFNLNQILSINYMEYYPSTKYLNWHTDISSYSPYNLRKLSFSIGLNSKKEYKGGNLSFFLGENNILDDILDVGDIVFFPSFIPHKVTTITEGVRKTLVGFLGGEPYK